VCSALLLIDVDDRRQNDDDNNIAARRWWRRRQVRLSLSIIRRAHVYVTHPIQATPVVRHPPYVQATPVIHHRCMCTLCRLHRSYITHPIQPTPVVHQPPYTAIRRSYVTHPICRLLYHPMCWLHRSYDTHPICRLHRYILVRPSYTADTILPHCLRSLPLSLCRRDNEEGAGVERRTVIEPRLLNHPRYPRSTKYWIVRHLRNFPYSICLSIKLN